MLVASFAAPVGLAGPSPAGADPGICKWDTLEMPGSVVGKNDILHGSEVNRIAVGNDGVTVIAAVTRAAAIATPYVLYLYTTATGGIVWEDNAYRHLRAEMTAAVVPPANQNVWDVAIAPDDPKLWAVVTSVAGVNQPTEVWVTENAGGKWECTQLATVTGNAVIGAIDISPEYGGERDIAVGSRTGWGTGAVYVVKGSSFAGGWVTQGLAGDIVALRFSPNYAGDSTLVAVTASASSVSLNLGFRDLSANQTTWNSPAGYPVLIAAANAAVVGMADLELPSDFSGAVSNLRRYYVSVDAVTALAGVWGSGPADVFAVGAGGTILHYDGANWSGMVSGTTNDLLGVWGTAWNDVFVVGMGGTILHYDGANWSAMASGTANHLLCVWGSGPLDVFAVGVGGTIQHYTGALPWANMASGTPNSLAGVWGSGPLDVFAVGVGGTILRYGGASWNTMIGGRAAGVYRIDDTQVYRMTPPVAVSVSSIAHFGTCASGKLLAGEVLGDACTASVPTWFGDISTACGGACWYPALKLATGAAGVCNCTANTPGFGNAQVAWNVDGSLAYCATGASPRGYGAGWYGGLLNPPVVDDESAFSISRNDAETWNQLGLIDTTVDWFNDVAPVADCTTLYLASASDNLTCNPGCNNFDSVWRTSTSPAVVSPLQPAYPLGSYYERVLCRVNAVDCEAIQSELPLLRLAPDMEDGEVLFWGAQNTRAAAWSPDFGDYWANINPRNVIQDFVAESSTVLYFLDPFGLVQAMPYTGIAWSSFEPDVDTGVSTAHMITAQSAGKVLVGADANYNAAAYPAAISTNGGADFNRLMDRLPTSGNVHVAFDPDFDDNYTVYLADDSATGTVYRNNVATAPLIGRSEALDMMAAVNGAAGSFHPVGYYGLQLAFTGHDNQHALYGAHDPVQQGANSGVDRVLYPLDGMPKPGLVWDCLNVFTPPDTAGVMFTREPWSLKICGCLTLDTDTTLYALDARGYDPANRVGMLWAFTDCMAKAGPALITEDEMLVGCDPVSGRSQEVNFAWEQLCLASAYDIEVAKNEEFTIRVVDWVAEGGLAGFLVPAEVTSPACYFPAGGLDQTAASAIAQAGNLECGHTYYWRVKVRQCATTQVVRSPWSEVRSFTVKAGLPVRTSYYGVRLLAPDNGCIGCRVSPASFSWAPFKGTEKYKFILAKDSGMTDVIAEAEVSTTAYEYDGTLDYSTNYFWRVMSLEPAPSDWSATFSFQTEAAPALPPAPQAPPSTPLWVWAVIAVGLALGIATLILILRTRWE